MTPATHSKRYLAVFLVLVFATNVVNIGDRLIFGIVLEPIKAEFSLSDTQLGLVSGLAFAVIYSTLGIPVARLADRGNRRNIVAWSVGIWSAFTMLCGVVSSYWQLIAARIGVAAGESGYTPALNSMMADKFAPGSRARVMAVYGLGASAGILVANGLGGVIAEQFGWRYAFLLIGLPGVILAIAFRLLVREPVRGASEVADDDNRQPSLRETLAILLSRRSLVFTILGAASLLFTSFGALNWLAPFLVRLHGMSLSAVGASLGLIIGVFGAIGTLLGGFLADRLSRRGDLRWQLWVPAIGALLAIPLGASLYSVPTASAALAFLCAQAVATTIWQAPTLAYVQTASPLRTRATIAAFMFFMTNMIGYGIGPAVIGVLSDWFAPTLGQQSLRAALLISLVGFPLSAIFYFLASRSARSDLESINETSASMCAGEDRAAQDAI